MSQIADSPQVFWETGNDKQAEVDVVDEEEEEDEILVDQMVNNDTVDHGQERLPTSHVYCPLQHMTSLNLGADEPLSDIFHNLYM